METLSALSLAGVLPSAPFKELHTRDIARPIEAVWQDCLNVTGEQIRSLGPLFALRSLPATLRRRKGPLSSNDQPVLELFAGAGFSVLHRDEQPIDGQAAVFFGAVGKFWSPVHNHSLHFETPDDFLAFDEPGYAKTVARLQAFALADGTTRVETETWVDGTDSASRRKFRPYWALIRLPSGLIRRSWLAAIERRGVNRISARSSPKSCPS